MIRKSVDFDQDRRRYRGIVEVIAMLFNGQLQKNHRRFIYS
jgi:hypothetical protein